jgi:hypothetical protein
MTDNIIPFPEPPKYPRRRGAIKYEALHGSCGRTDWAEVDRKTRKDQGHFSWPSSSTAAEIAQAMKVEQG